MSQEPLPADSLRGAIAWMVKNPIAANLVMLIILFGGLWSVSNIKREVFPESVLDIVDVSVGYPGAAPTEVEQGILQPLEDAIRGIDGVRDILSEAREGGGSVEVEFVNGTERTKALQDVTQAVDRIRTFPADIENPQVTLRSDRVEVIQIGLYGNVDIWSLRKVAEQLRDQLLVDPNITQVELDRVPSYITHVEIPRYRLREYNLTLAEVARMIEASSNDAAAGSVQASSGEFLLRVKSRKQWADEFAQIEVLSNERGSLVTLGDIATIRDGFSEDSQHAQFNGQASVRLGIFRVGEQSPVTVAKAVENTMRDYESVLPPGVSWRIDSNNAEEYRRRFELVKDNGLIALAIVLIILAVFLELRLAFWAMIGMALSFIGGLILLPSVGVSINMISLFGFLVALGIVVDDAIIIGENVYEHRLQNKNAVSAAIDGAREIAGPVTFSILTSIVAFIPLTMISGENGMFWRPLPIVVIVVLAVSLMEALFILPAHLGHVRKQDRETGRKANILHRGQQAFSKFFQSMVGALYRPVLRLALTYRYVTAIIALAAFWVVATYATSAHMGMIPMPEVSADEIEGAVRLPTNTTPDQAAEIADSITSATMRMFEEHSLYKVAEGVTTNVRGQRNIDVEIVMKPPDERDMTSRELTELWRDSIGDLPGIHRISFEAERGPGRGRDDISIALSHGDESVLEHAATALVNEAGRFSNTRDVSESYDLGKTQLDFQLLPEARVLGLTAADIGEQLRGAFHGSLALRLMRGTNEIEVRVKLPEVERKDIHNLEDLVVRTPQGAEVPLLDIVEVSENEAFSRINRRNGRRIVSVSMDVEPKRAAGQVISALDTEVLPELRQNFPGLTWTFEGRDAAMRESMVSLAGGFGMALFGIYALLAIALKSYAQPLVVLGAVPFGIIGAVFGHMLLGYDLSLVSVMGIVALSGIVVNDSLIMIDFANRKRADSSALEAIIQAGLRRFRPIFLTTATTFCGLSPLILETSLQAQYIIPMAISLGFGIVFATVVVLILVPCLYMILEDIAGETVIEASHEPA